MPTSMGDDGLEHRIRFRKCGTGSRPGTGPFRSRRHGRFAPILLKNYAECYRDCSQGGARGCERLPMLRIILLIGFISSIVVVGGGYLILFPPLPLLPEIARGLPSRFSDGERAFQRRVAVMFSGATTEAELVTHLEKEGFTVDSAGRRAVFEKAGLPCRLSWRVFWEADGGSVSNLKAEYGGICL